MREKLRELLIKYQNKQIETGNFAHFMRTAGNLSLMNWHEGRHDAYAEIVADLTALLKGLEPEKKA